MQLLKTAALTLNQAFYEQVKRAQTRTSETGLPVDTSDMDRDSVPIMLRTGWPLKAIQVMQIIDELHADMLEDRQQHQTMMIAADTSFVTRMQQRQKKLEGVVTAQLDV